MTTIGLVTPAFNSGELLIRTVKSVSAAWVEGLQYAIWDGGGDDGSARRAMNGLPESVQLHLGEDDGQYDALKKGFEAQDAGIMGWVNAGDTIYPWTLREVLQIFDEHPEVQWIYGLPTAGSEGVPRKVLRMRPIPREFVRLGLCVDQGYGSLWQEAMFWRRDLYRRAGGLDAIYQLAGDFDLWMRMAKCAGPVAVSIPLALFAHHGDNRSVRLADEVRREVEKALEGLTTVDRRRRNRLLYQIHLLRKMRKLNSSLARLMLLGFGLAKYRGRVIDWNSRENKTHLSDKRFALEHIP